MTYYATFLEAAPGKRLAKTCTSVDGKPLPYNAGNRFRAHRRKFETFSEFVDALAAMPENQCLIRGKPKAEVTPDMWVRRLLYNRAGEGAAFESAKRNWLVLDFDESKCHSAREIVESLPWPEARATDWAWFPSASQHLHSTARGKLVLALATKISDEQAAELARQAGADPSVCRAVTPNYFAAPKFIGCEDPISRKPFRNPAKRTTEWLPDLGSADIAAEVRRELAGADDVPDELPPPSGRAKQLVKMFRKRWLRGARMGGNAALHMFGWLLGQGWGKPELGAMLELLDADEPDELKRADHRKLLRNAVPLDGPGGFRDWMGSKWERVDNFVNGRSILQSDGKFAGEGEGPDPWEAFESFLVTPPPLNWLVEGLRLAPSKGKISLLGGQPGAGKGPFAGYLAVCIALGIPVCKMPVRQAPVLWLDEEGTYLTMLRMHRFARGLERDPAELEGKLWVLDAGPLGDLRTPEARERLTEIIRAKGIGFLGLDSYTSAMLGLGVEFNQPEFASLARALGQLNTTVLAVAHANKAAAKNGEPRLHDVAGSGALPSQAQTVIMAWQPDLDDEDRVTLSCGRAPTTKFQRVPILFRGIDPGPLTIERDDGCSPIASAETKAHARAAERRATGEQAMQERLDRLVAVLAANPMGMSPRLAREAAGIAGRDWDATYALALQKKLVRTAPAMPHDKHPTILLNEEKHEKRKTADKGHTRRADP